VSSYAEFRLVVTPDTADRTMWRVTVDECPLPGLVGDKGSLAPTLTRPELNQLRSAQDWPNLATLRTIGEAVWSSVMTPDAKAALLASIQSTQDDGKRLRIVVVLQGDTDQEEGAGSAIRLSELPVEALHQNDLEFIATDLSTPISRSLQARPDRDPANVVGPLRVLVALAAPTDKPPADIGAERDEIRDAVSAITGPGGALEIDVVEQATRTGVADKLRQKPYHVLHFIGHGGFEVIGQVKTPRAHLCFVRPDGSGLSDPTDADTLLTMLRNTSVRLVVITACSSAAPTAPAPNVELDPGPLGTGAFDGVAQRLVSGVSPVNAAVAMQFDLETSGAVAFSKAFYTHLLEPGVALDEVVTHARRALIVALEAGHRAWVTPTVYWRAKDGRVFDIDNSQVGADDATLSAIGNLNSQIVIHRGTLEKIAARTSEDRPALAEFRDDAVAAIAALSAERAELLGETIRVTGGTVTPGTEARCRLTLRIRQPGTVDLVALTVNFPPEALTFVGTEAGADSATPPMVAPSEGAVQVSVIDPGGGNQWPVGEYELGFLRFELVGATPPPLIDVTVTAPRVNRDGAVAPFKSSDGLVIVVDAP
jgi:CHAT domain